MGNMDTCTLTIEYQEEKWTFSDLVRQKLQERGIEREQIQSIVPVRTLENYFHVIVLYRLKSNLDLFK